MFLSTRDPEEAWGNVRECTEAAHRLAEVVGGLRSRVPARAEERAAVCMGRKRLRGAIAPAEARGVMPTACWAFAREPCESLALWVPGGGGFALRSARRRGGEAYLSQGQQGSHVSIGTRHVLTLFRMRSEHLQGGRLDTVKARESQGGRDALEQLSFGIFWILRRRLDGFRYLLDVL